MADEVMKRFVVTGTVRAGTKWCATALRIAGYNCGHEQVFTADDLPRYFFQPVAWFEHFEGDASFAAVPWLPMEHVRSVLVVRHPLSVAGSILHAGPLLEDGQPAGLMGYLREQMPDVLDTDDNLDAALRYWIRWNDRASAGVDTVLRLEDLTVEVLLDALGLETRWAPFPLGPVNASSSHLKPDWRLAFARCPRADDVVDLTKSFGYTDLP